MNLIDELLAERHLEAAAEDQIGLTDDVVAERNPKPRRTIE
ncbi:hypothetical protein [Geodermatophilus amargosae]|nr:hypothetical protein [Geodermatophilus amargosae]